MTKIKVHTWTGKEKGVSVEDYITTALEDASYDGGRLEAISRTAENTAGALGRLTSLLLSKGILELEDIHTIAGFLAPEILGEAEKERINAT